jgi:class 3 adenylate cyclase/tetratricopeptide (TPR) repeat protein
MSRDVSCERCGHDNPQGFRYCGACGAPLIVDWRSLDEERKVVSALFCDVVGSTERAEKADPEDVRRVLRPYYRHVRGELARFGGTVEKFIGDAVCGLFGAPRSHGDDPERAVRAALEVRDTIAVLNEADPELDLHVRLGVATGEALVALDARSSEGEAMAWGDVMNTASRLQTAAPIDAILVDETTYLATRGAIRYGIAEPIRVRGKSEPVVVWQALAPLARRGADLSQVAEEPLVGRTEEHSALVDALDRVVRGHRPELVTVIGEAGIGKSRLVSELLRHVHLSRKLIRWRQARSSPYGDGFTYWALGEIVKAQAGILETDDASTAEEKLGQAVRQVVTDATDARRIGAQLRSLVGIGEMAAPQGDQRQAAFASWRRFVEAIAERYPLVLVFEDIHWAGSGLLDFIEHVLDWARDAQILIVCTARPELAEVRPDWGGARTNSKTLALAPLSTAEINELVGDLGSGSVREDGREAVVETAAGNPLFAVEFARLLVDSPEFRPSTESVHGVIAARIDALPVEDKTLLQDAAVVGKIVWPGVLAQIEGRPRRRVDAMLRDLVRQEFLAPVRDSSVEGEAEFTFRHVLVRDVAYDQIPRGRRGEIHRRVAAWLESLSPDRASDRAEMISVHYLSAYEYALATRADTTELVEGARIALRDAGDRALALNAFAAAERHFAAAVDLWPDDDPELPSLLLRLGTARYYGDNGGDDELVRAEGLLSAAGDPESAAEAAILLANLAQLRAEPNERFFEHAHRALALVEDREPSRAKIEVCLDLAVFLTLAAEQERAIGFARDALRDAETLALIELQARALAIIGAARGMAGDPDGRSDLERSIAIVEEIDSPLGSHHCGMLADLECNLGNLARCFELQARARTHAERFGHLAHVQWLKAERVAESYWRGQWDDALELADEFLSETGAGGHFMEGYCRDVRARICLARDDVWQALTESDKALDLARDSNQPQMLCPALAVRARVLAADGRPSDAAEAIDELFALWDEKLNLVPAASWIVDLSCALADRGRADELRERAERVHLKTAWLEAALAFTSGAFADAAAAFATIGSRPDEALARLRAAQTAEPGRRDRDELELALAFYRQVEAGALLREAAGIPVA